MKRTVKQVNIVGLGEVVLDWVAEVPHFPTPDGKIDALSENYFPGGVTANYLVALARLEGHCGFIGAVGDDSYGDLLIDDFLKENIDTSYIVKKHNKKTPVNFIFVAKGEKSIIQSPHMQTTKLDIEELQESSIADSKLLHTTMIHQKLTHIKSILKSINQHYYHNLHQTDILVRHILLFLKKNLTWKNSRIPILNVLMNRF